MLFCRLTVSARLPQHQNKFDVIFDDGIGFVRFAEEAGATIFDFIFGVGNLVPEDRSEVIKADATAANDDIGVQGHDHVATVAFARKANVADNADEPAARNENAQAVTPNAVEFIMELLVVRNETELPFVFRVFLQSPIGRGRYDEVDRLFGNPVEFAGVTTTENLICFLDSKSGGLHCWNDSVCEGGAQSKAVVVGGNRGS